MAHVFLGLDLQGKSNLTHPNVYCQLILVNTWFSVAVSMQKFACQREKDSKKGAVRSEPRAQSIMPSVVNLYLDGLNCWDEYPVHCLANRSYFYLYLIRNFSLRMGLGWGLYAYFSFKIAYFKSISLRWRKYRIACQNEKAVQWLFY